MAELPSFPIHPSSCFWLYLTNNPQKLYAYLSNFLFCFYIYSIQCVYISLATVKDLKHTHAPPILPHLNIESMLTGTGLLINTQGFKLSLGAVLGAFWPYLSVAREGFWSRYSHSNVGRLKSVSITLYFALLNGYLAQEGERMHISNNKTSNKKEPWSKMAK